MPRVGVIFFVALGCLLLQAAAASAQEPARLALLIGNKNYAAKVGPLRNPHHDVTLVGTSLSRLGFKVTTLKDADYRGMDTAVRRHVAEMRAAGRGAIGFFHYSGHGVANPDTQVNYLIPVDVADANDANLWFQSFEQSSIIDRLSTQAPNATHYVVFDACRNELNLTGPGAKALGAEKGFVPVGHASGLLIAYSTAPKQTASDTGERGGPYATILAEELVKPNVEAVTMFRNVQIRVKQAIGQDPWLSFPSVPPVYFARQARSSAPAKTGSSPALAPEFVREAADAWSAVKDTTNLPLLEAYLARYKDTFYAEVARARIAELKKQVAVLAPPQSQLQGPLQSHRPADPKASQPGSKPGEKKKVAVATPPSTEPRQPAAAAAPPVTSGKPPSGKQVEAWRKEALPLTIRVQSVLAAGCCWSDTFAKSLAGLSGGKLKAEVLAPGSVVPQADQLDAVSAGKLMAGWSSPNFWTSKSLALHVYSGSVPLGLSQAQLVAWMRARGERELNGLYQDRLKLKVQALACGSDGAEGMWFKKPINSVADLRALRVRTIALSYVLAERLGAKPLAILGAEKVMEAFEGGAIDAAEFGQPWFDESSGFPRVARHYYYPGWHAPAYLWQLELNRDKWSELSDAQKGLIAEACRQNALLGASEYEAKAQAGIDKIRAKGVQVHTLRKDMLDAIRVAREEVVQEFSAKDPDFKRACESYSSFR